MEEIDSSQDGQSLNERNSEKGVIVVESSDGNSDEEANDDEGELGRRRIRWEKKKIRKEEKSERGLRKTVKLKKEGKRCSVDVIEIED